MFKKLFVYPAVQSRHIEAPFAESREQFLFQCERQGYLPSSLHKIADALLLLVKNNVDLCEKKKVTLQQIEGTADCRGNLIRRKKKIDPASSRQMYIHYVTEWFRFQGIFVENDVSQDISSDYTYEFECFMRDERGLSSITIKNRCEQARNFLEDKLSSNNSLHSLSIKDVDDYLTGKGNKGWSRGSLHTLASTLRCFFQFAESRDWVNGVSQGIESPRVFSQEYLPLGLTWEEVEQLAERTSGNSLVDIRNHAIILLLATYGFRRGEVAQLKLESVDWRRETLQVKRSKQGCTQHYPLVPVVGNAIIRYLTEARPKCECRELFLAISSPVRPISPSSISAIVHSRLAEMGVTRSRIGAHCLRHSCAQRLLNSGFSLKQIGDQLGHRSASATLNYAKIDLNGLRQVADIDLGGVL
jgi:site-specific recombinase XerD